MIYLFNILSIILLALSIINNSIKIDNLEKLVQSKSTYQCNHVIAVMTPDGLTTSVCTP